MQDSINNNWFTDRIEYHVDSDLRSQLIWIYTAFKDKYVPSQFSMKVDKKDQG